MNDIKREFTEIPKFTLEKQAGRFFKDVNGYLLREKLDGDAALHLQVASGRLAGIMEETISTPQPDIIEHMLAAGKADKVLQARADFRDLLFHLAGSPLTAKESPKLSRGRS